ncbi:TPA: DUF551 domain-containing protein [Citrobacter braakii]
MTTNHPAHGPVSLDRLHQIREILSKASAQSDGGNLGYAMADAVKVIDEVLSVPETLPCSVHLEPGIKFGKGVRTQCLLDALRRRTDYYAELEAMTPEQREEHDAGIAEVKAMLGGGFRDLSQPVDPQIAEYEKAMLQAGNSPVTPDGWIPASERVPDKLIPVMVMYEDGEMWSAMWNGDSWDDGTEYPDPREVTHWREMPAAPQQEVK